jgi:DNA transposition AAA+ family ATPase
MSPNTKGNKQRLAAEAPENAATRKRLDDYLSRTGLTLQEFARRLGYGHSTMVHFMGDRYQYVAGSAHNLRTAIHKFIEQHPVAPPTQITGDLYETENVRVIRDTFEKLLPKPVAYMIYAPPGSQKTFALESEVARFNAAELAKNGNGRRAFYVYARQGIRPQDLVKRVAIACGSRAQNTIDGMLSSLRFDYSHRRVLLIVDEAQHLSIDCFEILRELLDRPPYFSLLFSGSHDLKQLFDRWSATLEQWNSRIIDKVRLPGLEPKEAKAIIEREIGSMLKRLDPHTVPAIVDQLILEATTKDAFEKGRKYINVRTLTNALDQMKTQAALKAKGAIA